MKKPTHAQEFKRLFYYWCGRLKLKKPINAIRDNRMDAPCCIDNWETGNPTLKYNSRILGHKPKCVWIADMFHEIGHIINNLPYDTKKEMIISEYNAEKFALKCVKKYYPKQYKLLIKRFIDKQLMIKKYKKKEPLYYQAFIRLKDYRDTIKK